MNQFLNIIKVIIVAINSHAVIDNTLLFISFKAIKKSILSISFGKQRKPVWLDFLQQSISAI